MYHLRRICWTVLVLATASSTLFANVPLVACACSVAVRESKSTEEPGAPTCCCCKPQPETCCSVKPPPVPIEERDLLQIRGADCQKAITQHEVISLEERHADLRELVGAGFDWCALAQVRCLTLPRAFSAIDLAIQEPPPTNLVVSLQHFII
jgi:hypothetical protein